MIITGKISLELDRVDVIWLYADLCNRRQSVPKAKDLLCKTAKGRKLRTKVDKLMCDDTHMKNLILDIQDALHDVPIDFDSPDLM